MLLIDDIEGKVITRLYTEPITKFDAREPSIEDMQNAVRLAEYYRKRVGTRLDRQSHNFLP